MKEFFNFPTCHCHPQSLDSGSTPEAFVKRELELGTGVVTCTDHGTLGACRKIYDLGKKKGLIPIIGLEGYLRDDNCEILTKLGYPKNSTGAFTTAPKYSHVTMHAKDQAAYECMVRLLSKADEHLEARLAIMESRDRKHGQERKPLFTWDDLEELGGHNLTMTTGCMIGAVQRHLLDNNDPKAAKAYFDKLKSIVKPGNLYTEVFPHDTSKNWVSGVFIHLKDGTQQRYYADKTLKTDAGEIKADRLAQVWAKGEHKQLVAVKNRYTWEPLPAPLDIDRVEHIEAFLPNECRPWAANGDLQAGLNRAMIIWAKERGVPIIIGDDSHYARRDEKIVQDVRLSQGGAWKFYGSYHRQSSAEAFAHFQKTLGTSEAQFEGWVDNCRQWADGFKGFKFETPVSLPTKFYEAEYRTKPWFKEGAEDNSTRYTLDLIKKHGRMDWSNKAMVDRLRAEFNLLHHNGTIDLLPYFMIDEEVCSEYEKAGLITGPGRGSAAGLLLTYLMGITHVDPLKYGLSMDRFLTVDRIKSGKLPDIDQDLPSRDLLIHPETGWLKRRFGDHYAQISVDTTLKLKMAVKDVARNFHRKCVKCGAIYTKADNDIDYCSTCQKPTTGFVPPDIEVYTRKFAMPPQGVSDFNFVMGYQPEGSDEFIQGSIETDDALKEYVRRYPNEWEVVVKCLGLARQKSRHACAYVIANRPIHEFIPLTTISDTRCTSYTAPSVEAVGGLKMDFLVINSLNDIGACIKLIQSRSRYNQEDFKDTIINKRRVPGHRLVPSKVPTKAPYDPDRMDSFELRDIWDLPEDQDVFADVATGRTETVFQFNTPGAIQWMGHFGYKKPDGNYAIDSVEGMSAFTALDRPGPLDMFVVNPDDKTKKHNLLVEYARRARGLQGSPDILDAFDRLIPETYGVMVYQEQLQKVYQQLTGCSGPDAEEFRTLVAKKKMEQVQKLQVPFIAGASKTIGEEAAKKAWEFFITWGQYGFNKSHAVCYSVIGYACAWLKHHYPLEWWTSVLRNADKNEIAEKFWRHCGHLIDLPDVKLSGGGFEIQGERIRAPLSLLQGVGEVAHNQLLQYAPYEDIEDFCAKIQLHRQNTKTQVVKKVKKKINKRKDPQNPRKTLYDEVMEDETRDKLGTSALNRGVCTKMILSGAMDSLFPADMHLGEQLMAFENALVKHTGQKPKKGEDINPALHLDPIQRYQTRKKILPAFGADLLKLVQDVGVCPDLRLDERSGKTFFNWLPPAANRLVPVVVVNAKQLEAMDIQPLPNGEPFQVAAVCHVDEVVKKWRFGEDKREAIEMVLNVDGGQFKLVKWAGKDINLPENFQGKLEGAVIVAVVSRYKEGKPFSIQDIQVIRSPLGEENTEEKEENPNE